MLQPSINHTIMELLVAKGKTSRSILLISLIIILSIGQCLAQEKKRYKGKKSNSKREVQKRQDDAVEKQAKDTPFAPKKAFSQRKSDYRDDQIWKSQTAGIVYPKAVNISVIEPSKLALNKNFQLEAILPFMYYAPNVFGKYLWYNQNNWMVASRHGIYSATTGLMAMQQQENYVYADSAANIPFIVALKNELIVSRAYTKAYGCEGSQPYLILTGSIGLDYGYGFGENELDDIDKHFVANRSPALTGTGYTIGMMGRADYKINTMFLTGASLKYFYGTFEGHNAVEQKAWLETLLNPSLGLSVGYALSWGTYNTPKALSFMPTVDICWYFGSKKGHSKGLFDRKMF
jgi:hypothetical protein